jgi:hypothetical protein
MKEFMMIFRNEKNDAPQPSPEQMQQMIKLWNDWIGGIAAQDKLVSTNALGFEGKTVTASAVLSDGPYVEVKEYISGYTLVKAESFDEALKMAEGCPIYEGGGTVEVRDIMIYDM